MLLKIVFTLVFLTCGVTGENFSCANPSVMKNFDIKQYVGVWYEIEKNPVPIESGLKCSKVNVTSVGDHVNVSFQAIKSNGQVRNRTGVATLLNKNEPAKYLLKCSQSPYELNYWILDTDYKQYSVTYSCFLSKQVGNHEFVWVFSRTPTLPAETLQKINKFLDDAKVSRTNLVKMDQQNCK